MNILPTSTTLAGAQPANPANPAAPGILTRLRNGVAAIGNGIGKGALVAGQALLETRVGKRVRSEAEKGAIAFANTQMGVALEKKAVAYGKKYAGILKFQAELPAKIAENSKGLTDCRKAAAKVTSHFTKDLVLNQIANSKKDPAKPEWTDFIHDFKFFGPKVHRLATEHQDLITETIHNILLKGFKQFSNHLEKLEQPKPDEPGFMEGLGADLIEVAVKHLDDIHGRRDLTPDKMANVFRAANADLYPVDTDPDMKPGSPEAFYKKLTAQILKIAFPNGAKDLELPDFFDNTDRVSMKAKEKLNMDRDKLWTLLSKTIVPAMILDNIFKETTSRHTLNLIVLNSLNKMTEPKPPTDPAKPAFVVPKDALQERLNHLSGDLIDAFLKHVPDTMAGKLMGYSFIRNKVAAMMGGMLREQFQIWNLSKIIETGIMSGLPNWHPGKWTSPTEPTQFMPQEIQRGPDGLPLKDANGNVIVKDMPSPQFWFANTDQEKAAQAANKELETQLTEDKLHRKIDDVLKTYQNGYAAIAFSEPSDILLHVLTGIVKAVTIVACVLAFGIPFAVWGWKHISDKISSTIMAPQKEHLIKQRKRIMKVLHQPVQGTLLRRAAQVGINALEKDA